MIGRKEEAFWGTVEARARRDDNDIRLGESSIEI